MAHPSSNPKSEIPNSKSLPDRRHLLTEARNAGSADLDALSVEGILTLINQEDAAVPAVVAAAIPAIARLVDAAAAALSAGGRLVYLGAGTSGRLGVLDASECPPTFCSDPAQVVGIIAGGDGALRKSSEGAEDDPHGARAELERLNIGAGDLVVGIAAGGTTPYVTGGLTIAKDRGAATGLLCCVRLEHEKTAKNSLIPDHVIELPVGPEVVTGSTRMKAGTATKLALNMVTTATMVRLGKTWGNLMVDLRASNAKLRDRAARIIESQSALSRQDALTLLDQADGRVKVALVMALKKADPAGARRLLEKNGHRLRAILGLPK